MLKVHAKIFDNLRWILAQLIFQLHTSWESHHSHFWTNLYYLLPLSGIYQVIHVSCNLLFQACFFHK